ncbi:MAG: MFS transporter [Polyangiaceae bacterium]|nr:MFS transporter [Polyangiaceae bacterium]
MGQSRGRALLLITAANFVFFMSVTSFFTLPVYLERLGASRAAVGQIMGTFGLASLLAIPLTGLWADRFGRRPLLVLGALLWALGAWGYSRVDALGPAIYALRLLQGVAFSLFFVSANAVVADLAPEGRLGRAIAVFGTTTLAAHALGPTLGELVIARAGFARLFQLSAIAGLLSLCGVFAVGETRRPTPEGEAPVGVLALALRPGMRSVLLSAFAAAMAFGAAIHFMSVFVRAQGMTTHAPFFVAYVALAIGVRLALGGLGDRVGHRRVGALATLVFGVSVLGLSQVHGPAALAVVGACFGAAHGLAYPSLNALFLQEAGPSARGRAMASFNLSFNVGMTVAAFVAGRVAEHLGYGAMWTMMGVVAILGGLGVWRDGAARLSGRA